MKPPIYCDKISPGWCGHVQGKINEYCKHNGLGGDVPVPQYNPSTGDDCYCCCSCFAYGTPIEVAPQLYKLVQSIQVGEPVLATGTDLNGWQPRTVTELGGIAPEVQVDFMLTSKFKLQNGEERFLITTADHLFLNADPDGPTLIPVQSLRPGDEVRQADGGTARVSFVTWTQFSGGVRHFMLGDYRPGQPLDGHLVNSNGLVTADLSVQLEHYGGRLPEHTVLRHTEEDRPPIGTTAFHARYDTREYNEFVMSPELWPAGMRPMTPTLMNMPPSALAYFTQDQADDIQDHIGEQELGNSARLALTRYLFTTHGAYAPNVYLIVDWANESPNAWYFMDYKQRFIVLTGGLVRVPVLRREGLSIILAHLLAQNGGAGCTAEADYTGISLYLRQVWPDDLFFETFREGFTQIEEVFTMVSPDHGHGDPDNVCREPSLDCRKQSMMAGAAFGDLPSCAVPPPDFGVAGATASDLSEVTLTFVSAFNQPSASNPDNYELSRGANVLQVRFDENDPKVLYLTTERLEASTRYTLTVSDVYSATGKPLAPGYDETEFETP
ncbi:hypothetical protein [Actinomadura sp. 7K507]|uniref:hypothetical protein n=1 Tax=Actinomadura sp. 7K507 TaxID=2530365 RepID=UPI0010505109|nr:hypothetical protein [Actinomadura sp. 7K507]TDC94553.1 hypothetical protein E1285_08465 [Actinomadura sp. 7K507]